MSSVADRHTGRLGNRLADFGSHQPVSVAVAVADHVAHRREAQHTTWMLLNLLARAEGVIASITLDCPESVLLRPQVVPHLTNSGQPQAGEPLRDAIIRGANAIGVIPVAAATSGVAMSADDATGSCRHITVTDAPAVARDLAVYGRGWRAALHHTQSPVPHAISDSGHLRGDGAGDAVLLWALLLFPGSGACLRCHNAAKPELSDEQARAAALAEDGGTLLRAAAEAIELDPAELAAKLRRRDCDAMSERALTRLRELSGADVPEFSVGFVSVAAGVLLASETVKAYLGATVTGKMNRDSFADHEPTSVAFQFWRPHAATNGACHLGRDPQCPACDPDLPAFAVWHGRWQQWRDDRT